MRLLNLINLFQDQPFRKRCSCTGFLYGFLGIFSFFALFVSTALAEFEYDYERISVIHRQIENDRGYLNVYSETLRVRNAFYHLIYGSGDDFSANTVMYYSRLIAENSLKNNVDPMLVLAVIATESSFRRAVVSPVGAIGLMQLMPATARYISEKTGLPVIRSWWQLYNARVNISLGTAYLAYLIKLTDSVEQALVAYNIGPTDMFADIRAGRTLPMDYVFNVMDRYNRIKSYDSLSLE